MRGKPGLRRRLLCFGTQTPYRCLGHPALTLGRPEIFNTDQGSQFTSREYTGRLEEAGIAVSRDGRGRALDNVFVERLWRSVKYEDIYIKDYEPSQ